MADEGILYRYVVPLDTSGEADEPRYDPTYGDNIYVNRFTAGSLVIVQEEAIPQYHKDSVAVEVEEVPKDEYE